MAEILIQAKNSWMNNFSASEISAVGQVYYDSRFNLGDIIIVRPDGWQWGREEKFPNFILVKVPGLDPNTIRQYESMIYDSIDSRIIVKNRRYNIASSFINNLISLNQGVVTINNATLTSNIVDKLV